MHPNPFFNRLSWILNTFGALNWGLVGFAHFNLVEAIFGEDTFMSRFVYGLVGLSALWSCYNLFMHYTQPSIDDEFAHPFSQFR
jgi:uncharacterized membrane protein YuzA (DUF378 family)